MRLFRNISDQTIIEGVRQQDEKILNWLYDNYLQFVRKYVLNNSGSADDVPDVFQDSIIILYNQIIDNKLDLTSDLKGYFYGIARNVWSAQLRNRQRTTGLDIDIIEEEDVGETSQEILERVVTRAFEKLPIDQQKVIKMVSEGNSYETIAKKLDLVSEGNARKKKYMIKEALLDLMREDPEYQEYLRLQK
jgi:RNA polymerase sigma factor (sigma-70 family)